jgi:predicted RecB family nuclease
MTTQHDVSSVPLQGGYVAKQCPVRAQNDALAPGAPLPPSDVLERRFEQGRQFEVDVVDELLQLHPGAVVVRGESAAAVETATADSMARAVPLILSSRLPSDPVGRRVGKPDLLVAGTTGGYRTVDIKHHRSLEPAEPDRGSTPSVCARLDRPWLEESEADPASSARKRKGDLLQLAHYQRMLETAGAAAADGRYGGIIGVERRIVWYDLDAPMWRTPSSWASQKMRSTMEVYDFEFDFRLDVIAVALSHLADPSIELPVVPVRVGECDACPWWGYCRPQLQAGSGDVSLVPRVGWREWKIHRDRGVRDRAALAKLDSPTARLVAAGIDVAGLIDEMDGLPMDTPVAELPTISRRPTQLARLDEAGVATVQDVARLAGSTAAYSGTGFTSLPLQIDQARAALGASAAYRRRGLGGPSVPRADVEVDIDMENVEEGVYLWGALLTDRAVGEPAYRPFVTWEPLTPGVVDRNFQQFWGWLTDVRGAANGSGRTFHAYCYSASAENTYLRSLGRSTGMIEDVEAFIDSGDWVDMLRVFDDQMITGGGSGLKAVAPLAGFSWDVDDPGGAESMVRYDVAVGALSEAERTEARQWLLAYNRGDVEATLAIRNWLMRDGESIPSIESLDPSL